MKRLPAPVFSLLILLPASDAFAADLSGTLKKIKDSGTIAIGYRDSAVPFSFVGADRSPTGYSIDLCRQVVGALQQSLGLPQIQIKWVGVTSESRIAASRAAAWTSSAARRRTRSRARSRSTSA